MSKLKVRAVLDENQKIIEFDRKNLTYSEVRSKVLAKHKLGNGTLRFVTTGGDYMDVSSDQHLQRVLQEVTNSKAKQIEFKVLTSGGSTYSSPAHSSTSGYSSPSTTSSSTSSASSSISSSSSPYRQFHRPASQNTVPASSPTPKAAPAKGEYEIINWKINADRNSSLDKVKITHQATYPSKYDTDVRVVLTDGKKLSFECTYSYPDTTYGGQVGTRTVTVTQSFQLPVDIAPEQVEVKGHSVTLHIRN